MKNKTWKKWTPYEDSVLRSYVEKHPENLNYCFFLARKELNRTHTAVKVRWYNHLRKQTHHKGFVFMLFSKFKQLVNCKNVKKDYGNTNSKNLYR